MRALIIANGRGGARRQLQALARSVDLIIAADGGAEAAVRAGLHPHALVGDMDSVTPATRARLGAAGTELRIVPREKDRTDAELALELAAGRGATEAWLAAGLGGRADHALANVFLVLRARELGVRMRLVDGPTQAYLVEGPLELDGDVGDLISLIPLSPSVAAITTFGLRYPLTNEPLMRGATRGMSNVIDAIPAGISRLEGGDLLLIHTRQRRRL